MLVAGCATTAPPYQPDFGSVNEMKNIDLPKMTVEKVALSSPKLEKVTLRGGAMASPHGGTYVGYYRYALEEQLRQSRLFDKDSVVAISCLVTRNDLDSSGSSIGTADLAATFSATRNGKEVYSKPLMIHHEWPSSFVGAIAIPNAQIGYGAAVQKLMSALFADPEFLKATAK